MGDMTREKLAALTDEELLAYNREHHCDPYMTLAKAKGMQRIALQFWHVGAARTKADREAQAEARVACFRSCFHPTPLLSLSPTAELDVAKAVRTHRCTGFGCLPWVFEIGRDVRTNRRSRC